MPTPKTLQDDFVSLAHGNGGRYMRELIEACFARHLRNDRLDTGVDAAYLPLDATAGELMATTDGFTVEPLEFPGGDIGSLAVHGTVNDLAVSGATPLYLTLNAFLEEGLEIAVLDRIVASMAQACAACGVAVVAGDTKVLRRGQGGGIYLATAGVGVRPKGLRLGLSEARAGDRVVVSGTVGDHGAAVMLAREQFGLSGELRSDSASVLPVTRILLGFPGLRFMRDPTRGGLATVLHEAARGAGMTVRARQDAIPVKAQVRAICEMLGYDPYYMACEGRVVAILAPEDAERATEALKVAGYADAAAIGELRAGAGRVVLETPLGGERILDELEDDPLPRIC